MALVPAVSLPPALVVGDLIEIGRKIGVDGRPTPMAKLDGEERIRPIDDMESRYYLRLTVADRAGVLAEIARILGDGNISIASVLQKDRDSAAANGGDCYYHPSSP